MSQTITIPDDIYRALRELASEEGATPETLIAEWVTHQVEARSGIARNPYTDPRYYETDDWFKHLGMTDEQMREADTLPEGDSEPDADA